MKFEEIMETIKMLAKSQGFYGRLLRDIEELKENDIDEFEEFKQQLENQNFKDSVDLILFIEE